MAQVAIPMAIAAVGAAASLKGAQAQAGGLANQATMARMKARQDALKYKQQGVSVLDNMLATMATQNARAGAGNVDPSSGNSAALRFLTLSAGSGEFYNTREGQTIVTRQGELQALEYHKQAKAIMQAAKIQAVASIASAGYMGSQLGGAPSGGGSVGPMASAPAATYQPLQVGVSNSYNNIVDPTGVNTFMRLQ